MSGLTVGDPVELHHALTSTRVLPGDTLLLRAGTYTGDYTATIAGTLANPVIIRPYPGESVTLDGSLSLSGGFVHLYDLNFTDSRTDRYYQTPSLYTAQPGFQLYGCLVSDLHLCGVIWYGNEGTGGGQVCENVFLNNGVRYADHSYHGHCIYSNCPTGGGRLIARNVCVNSMGEYGLHLYGNTSAQTDFTVEDNVFTHPTHTGGPRGLYDHIYQRNIHYGQRVQLGRYCYNPYTNENALIDHNYFIDVNPFDTNAYCDNPWINLVESNNEVYGGKPDDGRAGYTMLAKPATKTWVIPYTKSTRWAGMVAIYNRDGAATVAVTFTGIAAANYKLRNCNHPDETWAFTWDGATPVNVPCNTWTARQRIGDATVITSQWPVFGALIIENV